MEVGGDDFMFQKDGRQWGCVVDALTQPWNPVLVFSASACGSEGAQISSVGSLGRL